jgi:hypothetical protein
VEKVTICRLSGLRATDACRHGWFGPDHIQAGLTDMPGVPAGSRPIATSARASVEPPPALSTVYDDYFTIGSAPTETCPIHGGASMFGVTGDAGSPAPATGIGSEGVVVATSYPPPAQTLQKIVGPDGRAVWVVR